MKRGDSAYYLYGGDKADTARDMQVLLKKTLILAGITAIFYVLLFLFVDKAIDIWVHHNYAHGKIHQYGSYISELTNGVYIKFGLALGFIFIIIYDPGLEKHWVRNLLYVCISGALAIIISEGLKFLIGRYRPIMLFKHKLYGLHFFGSKWALNSTPSGHTVRAFALLTALALLFRRWAVVFLFLALLIGVSRVAVTAHYPSDVLFGAFIGIFTAIWTYRYFFGRGAEHGQSSPWVKRP
jgi:membrane-associated phospholipid phosphatase